MEIKKGDRFRCKKTCNNWYTEGKFYKSEIDGRITNNEGYEGHTWEGVEHIDEFFEKLNPGFVPKSKNPVPPPPKPDSPTSPSHYKTYDIESIEMMIRIWGKEEATVFCKWNAMKYRLRAGLKGDASVCLTKEQWYLSKWKELRDDVTG